MTTLRIPVITAAVLALQLSACATSPQADARFGQSVRAAIASQVAEPAAVRNNSDRPVTGMDGQAARAGQQNYERSFGKPADSVAAPVTVINTR
ncbi:MAG: hypothetical protein JWP34_3161 [Massilia sp.]|jgi:hypothetical protein|nr:hypothetical protein [Massilia sp.]